MHERIERKLIEALHPLRLSVKNESAQHNVPPGSETHFNVIIVAAHFAGLTRVQRHRAVYAALDAELKDGVHALTFKALTPEEWDAQGGDVVNPAPRCLGGTR